MSVTIHDRSIAAPESGLIFHSVDMVLYDPAERLPQNAKAVLMLIQDADGEVSWEHGEYLGEEALLPRGWYFIGGSKPFDQTDYRVLLWCAEPPVPNLQALGWPT